VTEPSIGEGLTGVYYDNRDFTGTTVTRVDPQVNFNWGSGSPDRTMGADTFSVRWTGQVQAQYSQTYTFHVLADDGVRLWVNGRLLIDQWRDSTGKESSGSIALQAGVKYDIKLEYYEKANNARAQLAWSSPSTLKQVIPQSRLFPR
jgi:hypothetical protein